MEKKENCDHHRSEEAWHNKEESWWMSLAFPVKYVCIHTGVWRFLWRIFSCPSQYLYIQDLHFLYHVVPIKFPLFSCLYRIFISYFSLPSSWFREWQFPHQLHLKLVVNDLIIQVTNSIYFWWSFFCSFLYSEIHSEVRLVVVNLVDKYFIIFIIGRR